MKIWRIAFVFGLFAVLLSGRVFAQSQEEESRAQWGPTANFLVGKFNTNQTSTLFETMLGLEADLRGRSWDIGAAHGRPGHSYSRLTYSQVLLDDGSSLFDDFESNVASGVKWKGFKAEKVWRLGPAHWYAAPMISLHGGIGKISGVVTRIRRVSFWNPTARQIEGRIEVSEESPKELFGGLEWLPIAGLGVGATANVMDYATITVSVYGLEFPGTYKGSIQVTYWPWRSR